MHIYVVLKLTPSVDFTRGKVMSKKRKREKTEEEEQQKPSAKKTYNSNNISSENDVHIETLNKLAQPAFIQNFIFRLYKLRGLFNQEIIDSEDLLNIPSTEDALIKLIWLKSINPNLKYENANNILKNNQLDNMYVPDDTDIYDVFRAKYLWIKHKYIKKMDSEPKPGTMHTLINQVSIKDFSRDISYNNFDGFLHFIISCKDDYTYDELALIIEIWISEGRSLTETDNNGMTPLHIAAKFKNADALRALAEIHQKDQNNNKTISHDSTQEDQAEQIILLDNSTSLSDLSDSTLEPIGIDMRDKDGRTPLHVIIDGIIEEIETLKLKPTQYVPKQCLTTENIEPYIKFSTLKQWTSCQLPIDKLNAKGESALELAKNAELTLIPMYLEGKAQESVKMAETIDETNNFIIEYNEYIKQRIDITHVTEHKHFSLLLHHVVYYSEDVEHPITTDCITRILEDPNLLGNEVNFIAAIECKISYGNGPEVTPLEFAQDMGYESVRNTILKYKGKLDNRLAQYEEQIFSPVNINDMPQTPTYEQFDNGEYLHLSSPEDSSASSNHNASHSSQITPLGELPQELNEYFFDDYCE